jgi:RNA polymerase sigma-70 factor (ECF subfamily)
MSVPDCAGAPPLEGPFALLTAAYRRELIAHCYRMVGSIDEAEDLVQETYLRAWRSYERFERRSSVRTWLYRIATNACLTALQHRSRRQLPSGLGPAIADPEAPQGRPPAGVAWLQPLPDALVAPASGDPADVVAFRATVRLALIASLQYLPPRQRAVLIFRDVLGWSAAEVAGVLGSTTAAVKSTLQRARARLDEVAPLAGEISEPDEPEARALVARYMAAFEAADAGALVEALRADASIEAPPFAKWVEGRASCAQYLATLLTSPGEYRLVPTTANGQPAAAAYRRDGDGAHHAFGVAVLTVTPNGIANIVAFCEPGLVAAFGLPAVHAATGSRVMAPGDAPADESAPGWASQPLWPASGEQ